MLCNEKECMRPHRSLDAQRRTCKVLSHLVLQHSCKLHYQAAIVSNPPPFLCESFAYLAVRGAQGSENQKSVLPDMRGHYWVLSAAE
jgi:hypothetical protein